MRSQAARIGLFAAALALGCKNEADTIIVVNVRLPESLAGSQAVLLRATVTAGPGRESSAEFKGKEGGAVRFPTSFSLQIPRSVPSPVRLEVVAFDGDGGVLARSVQELAIQVGQKNEVSVILGCNGSECSPDAGASDGPSILGDGSMGVDAAAGRCGNGVLDDGELCDPAIPVNRRGSCPPADCNDRLDCTRDIPMGAGCRLECHHQEIADRRAGDRCCPAGASSDNDPDCSATCGNGTLDPGEACDSALPPEDTNACPAAAGCDDQDPCTRDELISAGTCAAVCAHRTILNATPGDACCPLGAASETDPDCPAVCGNGRMDKTAGETCDRALRAPDLRPQEKSCPDRCADEDRNACTAEVLVGAGCQAECVSRPIERSAGGDGCCLPGVGRAADSDCPAICGNGALEPGEACDKAIAAGNPGACPGTCTNQTGASCLTVHMEGTVDACSARCTYDVNLLCAATADGCCPPGCNSMNDPDCPAAALCGNGVLDTGESCDRTIAAGAAGASPATPAACNDNNACTVDRLLSAGTCSARCAHAPIAVFEPDGCCPPGANALMDADCPAVCGNRVVDEKETCDKALPAGSPGACPATCPVLPRGCQRSVANGSADACTARCDIETIKLCQSGDGCCPAACNRRNDDDCPSVCGNAVLESGESCDWAIPAGNPGACSFLCDDGNACTADVTLGRTSDCSRACRHTNILACRSGDGCCPQGCSAGTDPDCRPAECGDRIVQAGETCDPPSSCPSECIDDGDPCTFGRLLGDARTCTARCAHMEITMCTGTTTDRCCPVGCLPGTDVDCGVPPPRPTPY
jgi:hypothetical protein